MSELIKRVTGYSITLKQEEGYFNVFIPAVGHIGEIYADTLDQLSDDEWLYEFEQLLDEAELPHVA